MNKERRGNVFLNLLKAEWKYAGDKRKYVVLLGVLFLVAGVVSMFGPLVIGLVFNSIQGSSIENFNVEKIVKLIFVLLVIDVVFWIFHGTGRVIERRVGFQAHRNFVNIKLGNILSLPLKWHKDNHSGDTIDKLNRSAAAVDGFASHTTYQISYSIIKVIFSLIVLSYFDLRIAGLAFLFSVFVIFSISKFDKRLHKQYKELNEYDNKVSAGIYDYIGNINTVITLRLKEMVSKEIDKRLIAKYGLYRKNISLNEIKWAFATIAISIMTVIILSWRVITEYGSTGTVMIGTLFILYEYLRNVGDSFYNFADVYGRIVAYDASLANIKPIDDEFQKVVIDEHSDLPLNWKEIELKDMVFKHNTRGRIRHLDGISVKFKKGQKIALIGESGSGKSTIMSVIRGLSLPSSGKVFCDSNEVSNGIAKLSKHVTLVPQDPEIFNNTIEYNITMGLSVPKHKLDKAIDMAQFRSVLERLPKGLDTNVLEKGVSLSGGEKQRLALARGILAAENSDIILMDEPTSSVDSVNEARIYEQLMKEFNNKIIISSIHRLNLLNKFDYIYLFDRGKIVGEGTVSEIRNNALFKNMWRKFNTHKSRGL